MDTKEEQILFSKYNSICFDQPDCGACPLSKDGEMCEFEESRVKEILQQKWELL